MEPEYTKDSEYLYNIIHRLGLIDICTTFLPTTEYTFFGRVHRIFTKIDHFLDHRHVQACLRGSVSWGWDS